MDRLEALLSQVAEADGRGRGSPADASAHWRRELERAQWQLRRSLSAAASGRSASVAAQPEKAVQTRQRTAAQAVFNLDKPSSRG
jgi:hypothetical protein